jgi:hypothetical protein
VIFELCLSSHWQIIRLLKIAQRSLQLAMAESGAAQRRSAPFGKSLHDLLIENHTQPAKSSYGKHDETSRFKDG